MSTISGSITCRGLIAYSSLDSFQTHRFWSRVRAKAAHSEVRVYTDLVRKSTPCVATKSRRRRVDTAEIAKPERVRRLQCTPSFNDIHGVLTGCRDDNDGYEWCSAVHDRGRDV